MLAFAAFVPHPLLSIPEIGKDQVRYLNQTITAYKTLAVQLYAAKPDVLLVISMHTDFIPGSFSINQQPKIKIDFSKYGDLSDTMYVQNDIGFGYRVKESTEGHMPIKLTDDETLDYRAAVPLFHLMKPFSSQKIKVVSIGTSDASLEDHEKFGYAINRQINKTTDRIAVIASGDLAHGISEDGPTGVNDRAQKFNAEIQKAINTNNLRSILSIPRGDSDTVQESAHSVLATLIGVLDKRAGDMELLSSETAFGVLHVSAVFRLSA